MTPFENEKIDINTLPKFEEVSLTPLNAKYMRVVLINWALWSVVLLTALLVWYFLDKNTVQPFLTEALLGLLVFMMLLFFVFRANFRSKAYAFRTHDMMYQSGFISRKTLIIPFKRVQHIAWHEGILSRYFGLTQLEIYTAGESSSDIKIAGIAQEEALRIKQLLLDKLEKHS